MKILFICQCNVCRSPMAEFILKAMTKEIPDLEIASAAISGEKMGCDINEGAKECLLKHNIPFESRKATVFELKDYFYYDLIVCMDEWNKHNVKMHCLNDPDKKVYKLLDFSDRNTEGMSEDDAMIYTNVFDPYHSKDFERAFAEISDGCEGLKRKIQENMKMSENNLKYELIQNKVTLISGIAYIPYICMGGSGFDIAVVSGGEWCEGTDEIIAVCSSEAEARNAIDNYVDKTNK